MGFFEKIKAGLARTKENIGHSFDQLFAGELNDDFYDELEETLILSDMGVDTALEVSGALRRRAKEEKIKSAQEARQALREILTDLLTVGNEELALDKTPAVCLFIGVNGVGKTTTIGKLAARLKGDGKRVLMAAGDTFRAAAADQLEIWSQRAGVEIIRQNEGADPAAVVFDALTAAKARSADVVLVDTAGRLHNKQNLMNELNKISRVIDRELPNASRETLLVLDATTGQNGLIQARQFQESAGLTGVVLTKLDGTAKGGIVVAIAKELGVPVKFIGVGESVDDLMPFEPEKFVEALI
ncbi:MAG: signal recognition particle-docking protein FtsY [Pseudoflavonifractor sp.]|nr:signal recognition particle-docking protein FtsY [Pseudoflavonifractor sp.]